MVCWRELAPKAPRRASPVGKEKENKKHKKQPLVIKTAHFLLFPKGLDMSCTTCVEVGRSTLWGAERKSIVRCESRHVCCAEGCANARRSVASNEMGSTEGRRATVEPSRVFLFQHLFFCGAKLQTLYFLDAAPRTNVSS